MRFRNRSRRSSARPRRRMRTARMRITLLYSGLFLLLELPPSLRFDPATTQPTPRPTTRPIPPLGWSGP